jgi:hypothetical protein
MSDYGLLANAWRDGDPVSRVWVEDDERAKAIWKLLQPLPSRRRSATMDRLWELHEISGIDERRRA